MAKHARKAATDARSFRRAPVFSEKAGAAILVVTEGQNTEPAYFEWVRKKFAAPTVELVPYGAGRGDPTALAKEALRLRDVRREQIRNHQPRINQAGDFDEIWIVFDTDVLTAENRSNGIAYAESQGIKIAYSEPCFEFWLLLHATFTTAQMAKCKNVIPYLAKHLGWKKYSREGKKESEVSAMMEPLVQKEMIQLAVDHAKRIRQHHVDGNTTFPANPSTDVDLLLLSINDALGPANQFLPKDTKAR
jgi:hypothetical protein